MLRSRKTRLSLAFLTAVSALFSACSSTQKIGDQIPRTPLSHPLHPQYIRGPLERPASLEAIRRNLSRGSGFVFGTRLLFESEFYVRMLALETAKLQVEEKKLSPSEAETLRESLLKVASDKAGSQTCFLFETDATEKEELKAETWEMKLETLDGATSVPMTVVMDPLIEERLKKERLPFTVQGEACASQSLAYEKGFRVTVLRKDKVKPDAKEPVKPTIFEWTPWMEGVSKDLHRASW